MCWDGAYTKMVHSVLLVARWPLLCRFRSKVDYSWFPQFYHGSLIIWWGPKPPKGWGMGTMIRQSPSTQSIIMRRLQSQQFVALLDDSRPSVSGSHDFSQTES